jgi:hypothetical protein
MTSTSSKEDTTSQESLYSKLMDFSDGPSRVNMCNVSLADITAPSPESTVVPLLYQEPPSSTEKSKLLANTKHLRYPEETHHLGSDETEVEKNLLNNTKRKGAKIYVNYFLITDSAKIQPCCTIDNKFTVIKSNQG